MTTLLDTSALIYLTRDDSEHHEWCKGAFTDRKTEGPIIVIDIVYSEFSAAMESREKVDAVIAALGLERVRPSDQALFNAGKLFRRYREENRGPKLNVLPDFLIAAVAVDIGAPLLTGNTKDFRRLYDEIELICPE